jgi:predicted sugar kinase
MEISQMAAEAVADKYQLSQIYSQQSISENVRQEVSIDLDIHVRELVRRLILELKLSMVEERLEYYGEMLTQAQAEGNWDRQTTILAQQPQLEKIRREICQKLGNRVIVN